MSVGERALVGRVAAVAILLALLAAAWIGPINAYLGALADGSEEIAAKRTLLQRYRALAGAHPRAPAERGDKGLLYPDIPESQAIALLQETVKTAAAAARVEVRGLQVLRIEAAPGAQRIGIRINAAGDIASVGRLLHAVEAARPLLYPDNLHVQSRAVTANAAAAPLEVQLDIFGFKAGSAS